MNMKKQASFFKLGWSITCGILIAIIIQQIFPVITGSKLGWLSQLSDHIPPLASEPISYRSAIRRASPAVVHVYSIPPGNKKWIKPKAFFIPKNKKSLGSGIIVSKKGYILTNYHVIKNHDTLLVKLNDERHALAIIVGTDPETDLAVLKITLDTLTPIKWLYSMNQLHKGDVVLAIGNPFGLKQTVTMGIVSAIQRTLNLNTYENFIQTDAAINLGNSGGALINTNGKLIGITTLLLSSHTGSEGLGFAIPVDLANFVLKSMIKNGYVIRGWLGIDARAVTPDFAKRHHLMTNKGIVVTNVLPSSPAQQAGLLPGDILLRINHKQSYDQRTMMMYIATLPPGSTVALILLRNGEKKTMTITVGKKPIPYS